MKNILLAIIVLGAAAPVGASAENSIFGSLPFLPEQVLSAEASVISNVQSESSTGGQTVTGQNGSSVSSGDVSASASSHTVINSSNEGSSVEVNVKTTENGVVTEETVKKEAGPGESLKVDVHLGSDTANAEVSTTVDAEATNGDSEEPEKKTLAEILEATTTIEAETALAVGDVGKPFFAGLVAAVSTVFESFFDAIKFW